ncbi:unnamed protein product [Prunus armeniaca]
MDFIIMMIHVVVRAAPPLHPNWAKGLPGKPKHPPARETRPRQELGPTSRGKSKGRFRLGFSPRARAGNGSGCVGFVSCRDIKRVKNAQLEPNPFNKRVVSDLGRLLSCEFRVV